MWVIYKHTNLINGKIYIGQTCQNPEDRWDYGCGYKKHNLHFYNAIKKYGWKEGFSHEIIEKNILLVIIFQQNYNSIRREKYGYINI